MTTPSRAVGAAAMLASFVAPVAPLAAQDAAELCKSIGRVTVGQWSSYTMTGGKADGAKLRLAIVGQERRGDSTLYWLEISGNGGPSGKGGILQLLVPGFGVDATAIRGMIVKTAGQPAMKMPDQMVSMMGQNMGQNNEAVDVARRCASAQVVGWESVSVPAGSVRALHLKNVDGGEAWVARDVPFGIVKARPKDGGEMVLTGHGMDAKSSITEKPQEMPGMMLPKP